MLQPLAMLIDGQHGTWAGLDQQLRVQADQQAQVKAKQELKNFLLSNEENKRLKEEAKEQDRLSDIRYNAQHAEQLAKEEKVPP